MFANDETGGVSPRLTLQDFNGRELAVATGERFATLRATVPRSASYIVLAENQRVGGTGGYSLRLSSVPLDVATIGAADLAYNTQQRGVLSDDSPLQWYAFIGKGGDLITLDMRADGSELDSFLILMDVDLNELTANDNAGLTRDARIPQVRLPKDGVFYVLATRAGLAQGSTTGTYVLSITAGEITLDEGMLQATVRWGTTADLNLFVRDPDGRIVSYSVPAVPSGGALQIDSNTRCEALSPEPLEHIFWPPDVLPAGDYEIWVWSQDACTSTAATPFALSVVVDGVVVVETSGELNVGERFETSVRVGEDGSSGVLVPGSISRPSPQQQASEGGDIPIAYGDVMTAAISDEQYALFFRFRGEAGDTVRIAAERVTDDLDPLLVLRDASDRNLPGGTNDDRTPDDRNAELVYTLPAAGEYVIAVTRYGVRDGTTAGEFRLTLENLTPQS